MPALYSGKKAAGQPENKHSMKGMHHSSGHPDKVSNELREHSKGDVSVGSTRGTDGVRFKMQGCHQADHSDVRSTIGKQ